MLAFHRSGPRSLSIKVSATISIVSGSHILSLSLACPVAGSPHRIYRMLLTEVTAFTIIDPANILLLDSSELGDIASSWEGMPCCLMNSRASFRVIYPPGLAVAQYRSCRNIDIRNVIRNRQLRTFPRYGLRSSIGTSSTLDCYFQRAGKGWMIIVVGEVNITDFI